MGAVLLLWTSHSILGQKEREEAANLNPHNKFGGHSFHNCLVAWERHSSTVSANGEGGHDRQGSSLSTCQKWWANTRIRSAQLLPSPPPLLRSLRILTLPVGGLGRGRNNNSFFLGERQSCENVLLFFPEIKSISPLNLISPRNLPRF